MFIIVKTFPISDNNRNLLHNHHYNSYYIVEFHRFTTELILMYHFLPLLLIFTGKKTVCLLTWLFLKPHFGGLISGSTQFWRLNELQRRRLFERRNGLFWRARTGWVVCLRLHHHRVYIIDWCMFTLFIMRFRGQVCPSKERISRTNGFRLTEFHPLRFPQDCNGNRVCI